MVLNDKERLGNEKMKMDKSYLYEGGKVSKYCNLSEYNLIYTDHEITA